MPSICKEPGRIVRKGMGGFLDPPGYPSHSMSVEMDLKRRPENRGRMSLEYAVEYGVCLDDATRSAAKAVLDSWSRLPLDNPETKTWISRVLGYFNHCYNDNPQDSEGWSAQRLTINGVRSPLKHPERHAGVHLVRKFYPEYEPTERDFLTAR